MKDKGSPLTIKDGVVVKCRKKVTEVVIPEGVRKIGKNAFDRCESLVSVTIPESVTEIYKGVFRWCNALSEVRYGGTKEQFVHIEGVSELNSRLVGTGVLCVDGTLKLEERAGGFLMFGSMVYRCTDNDLVTLNIPENATKIGDWAFFDSKLTSLMIPSSVMEIGKYAFAECESLTDIRFGGTMVQWEAVKKRANWYLHTPVRQVKCSDGEVPLPPYTIKNGVLEVWYRNDTELVIPESVVRIGEYAFSESRSLISVTIPESVAEIGECAFYYCKSLTSVVIPDGVTKIGESTFYHCTSLTSVVIPQGVTEIDEGAFSRCESLTKVMLPESIAKIGDSAFAGCTSLAEIRYGGTKAQWTAVKKGVGWNSDIPAEFVHCSDGDATL